MIVGFNHNVLYLGVSFHVQTEDGGLKSPSLVTLLYHGGIIISSQKTSYADILGVDNLNQVVEDLAKEQHKGMLRRLTKGEFDARIREFGIEIEGEPPSCPAEPAGAETAPAPEVVSGAEAGEKQSAVTAVASDGAAGEEPLLGAEIEELDAVPLDLPVVAARVEREVLPDASDEPEMPSVADDLPAAIEPAFEPPSAEDRDPRQDVSEALDDLIFSYLTGGNDKS